MSPNEPKTGVTGVTGVTGAPVTCTKSWKLQWLRPLRVKNTNLETDVIRGVTAHFTSLPDPDEAGIEKCKAMAMGGVPEAYLDAWARLRVQKPIAADGKRSTTPTRVEPEGPRLHFKDARKIFRAP